MSEREGLWLGQLTKEELAELDGKAVGNRVTVRGEKWTLQWSNYSRAFYLEPYTVPQYAH